MDGNNTSFINDPESFLRRKGLNFKEMVRNSKVGAFAGIKGEAIVEFDLVPIKGCSHMVDVMVLGPAGSYAKTSRRGQPVTAHFVHWNGQTYDSGSASFGSLNLSACRADIVLTAPFTGCCFVVIRLEDGGLRVYHEPTEDSGGCVYPGEEVLRCGPDYSKSGGVSGNGVLVRTKSGWKAIVAERGFGETSSRVSTYEFS
ncbi:hypothetical protein V8J88_12530 [Massilia sp. W12]|uniref:hypothetical protein n=1 Tax=Massilia sp. W12 TaxID=3126507 RepID=UPI0030D4E660